MQRYRSEKYPVIFGKSNLVEHVSACEYMIINVGNQVNNNSKYYIYHKDKLLAICEDESIAKEVLDHLERKNMLPDELKKLVKWVG